MPAVATKDRIRELRRRGWNMRRIAGDQACTYQYVQKVLRDFTRSRVELTKASGGILLMSAELTQDELQDVLRDHIDSSPGITEG